MKAHITHFSTFLCDYRNIIKSHNDHSQYLPLLINNKYLFITKHVFHLIFQDNKRTSQYIELLVNKQLQNDSSQSLDDTFLYLSLYPCPAVIITCLQPKKNYRLGFQNWVRELICTQLACKKF